MVPDRIELTWGNVDKRARSLAKQIEADFPERGELLVWPIPRGGIPASLAVMAAMNSSLCSGILHVADEPGLADFYIDDIVDTGETRTHTMAKYGTRPFYSLVDKTGPDPNVWFSFPWERMVNEDGPEENVRRTLEYIGEDPKREGLLKTPARVVQSYKTLFSGYGQDPASVLTVFEDDTCDEMVIVRDIEFYSCCEHHLLPFFGKAHIAYIPKGRVIGLSKLIRMLEIFSRRLQIQERLCQQVTHALMEHLKPQGAACVIEARHLCMVARGVQKQSSVMVTSSLEGAFRETQTRSEFLSAIK